MTILDVKQVFALQCWESLHLVARAQALAWASLTAQEKHDYLEQAQLERHRAVPITDHGREGAITGDGRY